MNKSFLVLLAVWFTFQHSISQEQAVRLMGTYKNIKQSFNVVDETTGDYYIFLEDYNSVHGYHYNEQHKYLGYVRANDLRNKYQNIIGHQIDGNNIKLFVSNARNRSFGVLSFDFESKMPATKELEFKLNEKYLNTLSLGDKLYIISYPKRGSQLTIHRFDSDLSHTSNEVIFSEDTFKNRKDQSIDIAEIIEFPKGIGVISAPSNVVEQGVPNSLSVTSNPIKIYVEGSVMTLTSDVFNEFTQFITVDLQSFDHFTQRIEKPQFEKSSLGVKTNSLINKDNLFQLVSNRDSLTFKILDLRTQKLIKKYTVSDDTQITFKNTPIIQKGGALEAYREMEKTSKFLRKITTESLGIAIKETNGQYEITLGSATETESNNNVMIGAMVGGASGALIMASLNGIAGAYGRYKNTKTVEITGLFNPNFEHIDGEVSKSIFEEIDLYAQSNNRLKAETVFYLKGELHLGYFDSKEDSYQIVKF